MLAEKCKKCGKFIFKGVKNEIGETFCNIHCYVGYCDNHNYLSNIGSIYPWETGDNK